MSVGYVLLQSALVVMTAPRTRVVASPHDSLASSRRNTRMSDWVECAYCSEPTDAGRICDTCRGSKLPSVAPRRTDTPHPKDAPHHPASC